ncbi:TPA: hypothetical protein PP061_003097 [Salmonella bongori]|uniref:hypothetical protein n=1 Tax=Salmonella bongori TaxID=54736 RepID=UPI000A28BF4D|nr:hypothetical protein [Salmonella bongori]ECH9262268.1 hypothetical protein [Salmonella enterica subsp. enterica]ECE6548651.1 hypothetical protein [Salmonella bongori]ECI3520296.1 hypothetical protein [Salmonella bongori]EDP8577375.1 hypothetical protein [Salmonella bongori]EDP8593724.1 hypothetical protein [Salmonella bongori]
MPKKHMCRWLLPGLLGLVLCAPVPNTYAATVEAGFSPEGTALQLVLKTIETAQQEIVAVVARKYLNHWASRWAQGTDWKQTY